MIIRRLAVLSGFSTVVAERMGRSLASRQFSVAYCKLKMNDAREYMDKLLSAFDKQVNELSQEANNKIVAILVSCLSEDELINIENRTFFPLLRRFRLSPDYRADINKSEDAASAVVRLFKDETFTQLSYEFKKPLNDKLLLPIVNARSKKLAAEMESLYHLRQGNLSTRLNKEVALVKRTGALRIRGIDFKGCINSAEHPVRRCSETKWCDISARIRFGFAVHERFEFDVTRESGSLSDVEFVICDGSTQNVPTRADHLNMRINGDFDWG